MSATKPLAGSRPKRDVPTLKDVANSVGVSESTVSVVLNGARSSTRVSATTRELIIETARRMGYRPNSLARGPQSARPSRIAIYTGRGNVDSRNPFFAELLGGILDESVDQGAQLVVHASAAGLGHLAELVASRETDGVIVHPGEDDPLLRLLGDLRVPAVAMADRIDSLPTVCVDDARGGMLLAEEVARKGHRHAMFVQADIPTVSAQLRLEAFCQTAAELGVRTTIRVDPWGTSLLPSEEDLALINARMNPITAMVGWCDWVAERICRRLSDLDISIPNQVAVLGFDGFPSFYQPKFEITTIRAPWAAVGKEAYRLLLARIRGQEVPALTVLPVEFQPGGTS